MRYHRGMVVALGVVLFIGLSGIRARAQYTSGVEGTVTDPSGAVIPGARVTLASPTVGFSRTVTTSSSGYYRFPSVPATTFDLTVAAKGFKTTVQQNIVTEAARINTVNVVLQVGSTTTKVTVTTAPPLVNTSQGSVSGLIEPKQVDALPMVGRNFYALVTLTPGVTGLPSGGSQAYAQATGDIFNPEYGVDLNASGLRAEANNYSVDAGSVTSMVRSSITNVVPNGEDVQELRVNVNTYNASQQGAGAVVTVVTKQGTNHWHGSASAYHTDNDMNARTEFEAKQPVFRRNEFAGSIGGPIFKDKTFFFGSADVLKSGVGTSFSTFVASPSFISWMGTNYPNNISTQIWQKFPADVTPNGSFVTAGQMAGSSCSGSTLITTEVGSIPCNQVVTEGGDFAYTNVRNGTQWTARVDQNMNGSKDHLFGEMIRTTLNTTMFSAPSVYPAFTTLQPTYTMSWDLDETHMFSPTILNEASFTGSRVHGNDVCNHCEVPPINVTGMFHIQYTTPVLYVQNNFEWHDVVSMNHGAHSLKFGGDIRKSQSNFFPNLSYLRPVFNFSSVFAFAADSPFSETGYGFDPVTGKAYYIADNERQTVTDLFFQDDWKLRPNLSLTLGLRWENFGRITMPNGLSNVAFHGGSNYFQRIAQATVQQEPSIFYGGGDYHAFGPRFGFAWSPKEFGYGKLAIRGGFGIFYDPTTAQEWGGTHYSPPRFAFLTSSIFTPPNVPLFSLGTTGNPPYGFTLPLNVAPGLNAGGGPACCKASVSIMNPSQPYAYTENWSLGFQDSFARNWMLEAYYIGSAGHKLYSNFDINRFSGDLIQNLGVQTRINPYFGPMLYSDANMNSFYEGGTVALEKRAGHGLFFFPSYTFGKAIDQQSSYGGNLNVATPTNLSRLRGLADYNVAQKFAMSIIYHLPQPHFSSKAANKLLGGWGVSSVTTLQTGSPFSVYTTQPFQPVFNATHTAVIGNTGGDYNADGFNYDYPNSPTTALPSKNSWSEAQFINGVFNCSSTVTYCGNVFAAPPLGQEGNLGRNTYIGPGYADTDLAVFKDMKIPWFIGKEGATMELRGEAYNAFNRVNLTQVDGNLADATSTFGKSTSTFAARNIQVALRISF